MERDVSVKSRDWAGSTMIWYRAAEGNEGEGDSERERRRLRQGGLLVFFGRERVTARWLRIIAAKFKESKPGKRVAQRNSRT
jgi:hypothetical protein